MNMNSIHAYHDNNTFYLFCAGRYISGIDCNALETAQPVTDRKRSNILAVTYLATKFSSLNQNPLYGFIEF